MVKYLDKENYICKQVLTADTIELALSYASDLVKVEVIIGVEKVLDDIYFERY